MTLPEKHLTALNALVAEIAPTNVFYGPRLEACGGAAGFESLEDYAARMPFTTKAELSVDHTAYPPYGTNLTYPVERYTRLHQTSGTSGQPMAWLDTPEGWQWCLDNWKIVWSRCGARAGESAIFPFSFGPFLGFWTAFEAAAQIGIRCVPSGGQNSVERLKMIDRYSPEWLCCTPTYALHLASVAEGEGLDLSDCSVSGLIVGGEPGGSVPEVRGRIEAAWGARVFDHHGMTEVGPVSYSDIEDPNLLRLAHESYHVEVVNPETLNPVEKGEVGEVILTTLGRWGSPLLRYRTGDLAEPIALEGEDPAAFALKGGILGRADDMVVVRGVNLYPSALDAVVRSFDGIGEYQVTIDQTQSMTQASIAIENCGERSDEALKAEFENRLRESFGLRIRALVAEPNELPQFEMKAKRWNVLK